MLPVITRLGQLHCGRSCRVRVARGRTSYDNLLLHLLLLGSSRLLLLLNSRLLLDDGSRLLYRYDVRLVKHLVRWRWLLHWTSCGCCYDCLLLRLLLLLLLDER